MNKKTTLYIVATPIGNLSDISARAIEVLDSVDLILCEDTRVTKKLLTHFEINTQTQSYHHHSSISKIEKICDMLAEGKSLALVSDAGTPGVSDPGGKLVSAVVEQGIEVKIEPIPGPSAIMSALSICGFAADSFVFFGWPPHKKGRETFFKSLTGEARVIVFYESVHRIKKALTSLSEVCPDRNIVVGRELTKKFETVYRGTAQEVLNEISDDQIKGEFVIVLDRE
jgi:16S rRNA (cytidine1402-2'-O)-methyltransferase